MARGYGNGRNLIEDEDGNIRPRLPQVIDARAPQHDFTQDKPMTSSAPAALTGNSLTPQNVWDQMFHKNVVTAPPAVGAVPVATPPPTPLTTAAGGFQTHQQAWQSGIPKPVQIDPQYLRPGDAPTGSVRYLPPSAPGYINGKPMNTPSKPWGNSLLIPTSERINPAKTPVSGFENIEGSQFSSGLTADARKRNDFGWGSAFA